MSNRFVSIGFELLRGIPRFRFAITVLGLCSLFVCYCFVLPEVAKSVVRSSGYWFTFAAFVGACAYALSMLSHAPKTLPCKHRHLMGWFGLVVLVGSALLFVHADFGAKIMMDDEVLASTAKSLHQNREVFTATYGRWVENGFYTFDGYVDKRPWLYPFGVSLLHDFTGYRMLNPYIFNAMMGVCMIAALFVLGKMLCGLRGAILLPLLWLTLPLFQQNATGAGMDLLNVLMIVITLICSIFYLKRPTAGSEGLLAMVGVMLAYCRYESALFLLPVAIIIVIGWYQRRAVVLSVGTMFAPVLLCGLILQNRMFSATESLWELHSGAQQPFAFGNFFENLVHSFDFFFNFTDGYANSLWLSLLGFPCLLFFYLYAYRQRRSFGSSSRAHYVVCLWSVFLLIHLVIILCYHDGRLDRLFASRFSLPFYLLLSCVVVIVINDFSKKRSIWLGFIIVTVAYMIGFTLPMNAKGVFSRRNFVTSEVEWVDSILASEAKARCLIVDQYVMSWTLREYSSLPTATFVTSLPRVANEFENKKFSEMYLIDQLTGELGEDGEMRLQPKFSPDYLELELVAERSFRPFILTRISRIKAFNLDAITIDNSHAEE